MPRENPIQPGQAFHLPAAQQANVANLLKVLSSKKATEALKEIGKTKDSTWDSINDSIKGLNNFIDKGGFASIKDSIQTTVDLQVADIFSPLRNEITTLISENQFVREVLTKFSNELTQFIADNPIGATVGAMGGQIASMFLPGGPILIAIGALIGSAIEAFINQIGSMTEERMIETLEKGVEIFGDSDFGRRLAAMLALLEENQYTGQWAGYTPRERTRLLAEEQDRRTGGIDQFF